MATTRYNRNVAVYQDVKKALQEILTPQVAELRGQMVDLRGEIAGLRGEMDSRFAGIDSRFAEMDTKFALLRTEMERRFAQLQTEMERRFGLVDVSFAELRQEMNNLHTDVVRIEQVFGAPIESVALACHH